LAIAAFAILGWIVPARASDVSLTEAQAAVRALGFLDTLQGHSSVVIGVTYRSGDTASKAAASRTATILAKLPGPGSSNVSADIIAVNELSDAPRHYDALYLMPGLKEQGRAVGDFVRHQHIVSISNDSTCLDGQFCVLMIRANSGIEIILDTALAQAVQAKFSSVFTMMVKRK
jgi:hypothetical protein